MVMVEKKDLSCQKCGREMKEVGLKELDLPSEVIFASLPLGTDESDLIFVQCPLKHGFKVLIPAMSDEERKKAVRRYKKNLS
jgi:hypothetical protein